MFPLTRLSEFHDHIGMLVLAAPGRLPEEYGESQARALVEAFKELDEGFHFVEKKVKDPAKLAQLRQLLKDSLAAYQAGDEMKGAHLLQDFEDIVWPNRFKEYAQRKGIAES